MVYDERREFWRCPNCGGEWWEDVDKLDLQEHEQARVVPGTFYFLPHATTTVLPPVAGALKGKGSRKAGRKWKSSRRYKPWTQRYMLV
jgi:phage terminase large subunit GpA-like protein